MRLRIVEGPPGYEVPAGCPASTIPIPPDVEFLVKSRRYGSHFMITTENDDPSSPGPLSMTYNPFAASRFKASNAAGDRISHAKKNGQEYELYFGGYLNRNSGFILYAAAGGQRPPILFCLQPDNSFFVRSTGNDGPGTDDPTIVVTCPPEYNGLVLIDNGIWMSTYPDGDCLPDTLLFSLDVDF